MERTGAISFRRLAYVALFLLAACAQVNRPNGHGGTGHDDYNPVVPLPAAGSSFQSTLSTFFNTEQAAERTEYGFVNFVVSGCLGTTAAGLAHTPSSCKAYNANIRSTETQAITYPDNSTTWVAMDENTTGNNSGLGNFTRVAGTHYLTDSIDGSQPAMASDSQLLMKVTTAGGAITAVSDLRQVGNPYQLNPYNAPFGVTCTDTSGTKCFLNKVSVNGEINVQAYGAVGNDTTDDTAALQAAFNAAVSGGKPLFIPAGTYKITAPLVCKTTTQNAQACRIRGAGAYVSVLDPQFGGATTTLSAAMRVGDTSASVVSTAGFVQLPGASSGGVCTPNNCGYMVDVVSTNAADEQIYFSSSTPFSGAVRGFDGRKPHNFPNGATVEQEKFAIVIDGTGAFSGLSGMPFQLNGYITDLGIGGPSYSPPAGGPVGGIEIMGTWYFSLARLQIQHLGGDAIRELARPDLAANNNDFSGVQFVTLDSAEINANGMWGFRADSAVDGSAKITNTRIINNKFGGVLSLSGLTEITRNSIAANGSCSNSTAYDPGTGGIFIGGGSGGTGGTQRFKIEDNEMDTNCGYQVWIAKSQALSFNNTRLNYGTATFGGTVQRPLTAYLFGTPDTMWLLNNAQSLGDQQIHGFSNVMHLWQVTTQGTTANTSTPPVWNPASSPLTDGSVVWTDQGTISSTTYPNYNAGNIQTVTMTNDTFRQSAAAALNAYTWLSSKSGDGATWPQGASSNWGRFIIRNIFPFSNTGSLVPCYGVDNNVRTGLDYEPPTLASTLTCSGAQAPLHNLSFTNGVGIAGGGTFLTGSNSVVGQITGAAATGNVLTPGFTCVNAVECVLSDNTTPGGAKGTAQSTTTYTFSATAADHVAYMCSCR